MVKQLQLSHGIIEKFESLFAISSQGMFLFEGKDNQELLVNVIFENKHTLLISMAHFFEHEDLAFPDPCLHFRVDKKKTEVQPLVFKKTLRTTQAKNELSFRESEGLREFLYGWLIQLELQGFKLGKIPIKWQWQREEQQQKGCYTFNGRIVMSNGFERELSAFEKFTILLDLEAFVLHKGTIGDRQTYVNAKSRKRVLCLDELNKMEKSDMTKNLEEYDFFTLLLEEEY